MNRCWLSAVALLLMVSLPVRADEEIRAPATPQHDLRPEDGIPRQFEKAGIEQKLDAQVPLDLTFKDDQGNDVRLGQYFNGRPVLLVMAYFRCERLCHQVLQETVNRLSRMWRYLPGRDYEVVVVSFDPTDTPEIAAQNKAVFLETLNKRGAERAVHFLTGPAESSTALCQAVGFGFDADPARPGQYVHSSGVLVVTPEGRVSKYLLGLAFSEEQLRDAIEKAGKGQIGTAVQSILLFCGLYDGTTGKYTVTIYRVLRLAGALTAIPLIVCLFWHYRKVMAARPMPANGPGERGA